MPTLVTLLEPGALALTTLAAGYTLTLAGLAVTSVTARSAQRRRDARQTLTVLLRRGG
ncbi:hypothetical protein [Kitasatospora sp. NPDC002040]|uniref:hypothetical protein n=1 Tax=Kitasatospora sp. NPDC002040 TaxID=3154661 RepID=UPI003317263F